MKKNHPLLCTVLSAFFWAGMAFAQQTHENLNAVLWVQTAAEYEAISRQTYHWATLSLAQALENRNWTAALEQQGQSFQELPPAVILDLDETVLNNSSFNASLVKEGKTYTEAAWQQWVTEKRAGLVPGSLGFLTDASLRGVSILFVTNRICAPDSSQDPTQAVLLALGIPQVNLPGHLFCKTGDSGEKQTRRAQLAQKYRILLLVGDDLGDFVTLPPGVSTREGRHRFIETYAHFWGERWFVLSNPMYGSWERTVGFDLKKKWDALKP